ncbi:MAG: 4-(cytidine 5'-diphospho)-2-C-methyl-D-erythritol kinase [Methylococcaceae bacterium]|nr:4-(cytidine 5'-diphospho)-2-C-methyl-D-erythritol kinase [Methylococcaceae bacterium]
MKVEQNENTGWQEKWPAPAKLNLMLRIVGQRADGYHLLQTVFQFVEWCDWLSFHPVNDGRVGLSSPTAGIPEQQDLIVRAANLLKQVTGSLQGVRIVVEKNLPMGGGLGGGSSDAATTLVALNQLWNTQLTKQALMEVGLQLGADVPVFINGNAAWAEGVGEALTNIDLPENWIVILKPDCHVDTKEIFTAKELTRNSKQITIADFIAGQQNNDCLAVVRKLYRSVGGALDDLSKYGNAKLTGTGACVFAEFSSEEEARVAYTALSMKWQAHLTKGLNRSLVYADKKIE